MTTLLAQSEILMITANSHRQLDVSRHDCDSKIALQRSSINSGPELSTFHRLTSSHEYSTSSCPRTNSRCKPHWPPAMRSAIQRWTGSRSWTSAWSHGPKISSKFNFREITKTQKKSSPVAGMAQFWSKVQSTSETCVFHAMRQFLDANDASSL